jgi:hypothetical protein
MMPSTGRWRANVTSLVYLLRQGWSRVLRVLLGSIYIGNLVVLTRAPHSQLFQRLRGSITRRIVLAKSQLVWFALSGDNVFTTPLVVYLIFPRAPTLISTKTVLWPRGSSVYNPSHSSSKHVSSDEKNLGPVVHTGVWQLYLRWCQG